MTTRGQQALARECRTFARLLAGVVPTAYVIRKYLEAHERCPALRDEADRFDRWLVGLASLHPLAARFADSYARAVAPTSQLRKKLVLTLAILETSPPAYRLLDEPPRGGHAALLVGAAVRGLAAWAWTAAAVLVLMPIRLLVRWPAPRR